MTKIRAGVIGVGAMGAHHARMYSGLPEAELVGVADVSAERAGAVAEKFGVRAFEDYRELLPLVDAVSIAVETGLHHKVGIDCMEAGLHVLIEKPLAREVSEAAGLARRAEERGLVLQVGHIERFNPAFITLLRALEGENIFAIEAKRLSPFDPRVQVDVVFDLMIHDIDLICHILGSEPQLIRALGKRVRSDHIDFAMAQLGFPSGVMVSLTGSHVTQHKVRRIEVGAEEGFFCVDYVTQNLDIFRRSQPEYVVVDGGAKFLEKSYIEKPFIGSGEPLAAEIGHFLECVRTGGKPLAGGREGLRAVRVSASIAAAIEAASGGSYPPRGGVAEFAAAPGADGSV